MDLGVVAPFAPADHTDSTRSVFALFILESPRWLLVYDRDDEATNINADMQELQEINALESAQKTAREIKVVLAKRAEDCQRKLLGDIVPGVANHRRLVIVIAFGTMINMFGNFIIS